MIFKQFSKHSKSKEKMLIFCFRKRKLFTIKGQSIAAFECTVYFKSFKLVISTLEDDFKAFLNTQSQKKNAHFLLLKRRIAHN